MMDSEDILQALGQLDGFGGLLVPEFTWGDLRVDAIVINTRKRTIRGFEIKVTRGDYFGDKKWQRYSEFCSSLAIACPEGLIAHEEVPKPFGLLHVQKTTWGCRPLWVKRPHDLQNNGASLAWLYTYIRVLETEMPRLVIDNAKLRSSIIPRQEGK